MRLNIFQVDPSVQLSLLIHVDLVMDVCRPFTPFITELPRGNNYICKYVHSIYSSVVIYDGHSGNEMSNPGRYFCFEMLALAKIA